MKFKINIICFLLGVIFVLNTVFFSPDVMASNSSDVLIKNLSVDYANNPLGNDNIAPVFGWNLQSDVRGQLQTAYRIGVSHSKEDLQAEIYDVWDSGKVISSESVNIKYNGIELDPTTRYYWCVTVWDKDGRQVTSNVDSYFETGLMDSGWSNAKFIGKQPSGGFMNTSFSIPTSGMYISFLYAYSSSYTTPLVLYSFTFVPLSLNAFSLDFVSFQ